MCQTISLPIRSAYQQRKEPNLQSMYGLRPWDSELMATGYEVHAITFDTHIFQFLLASLTISYGH